MDKTDKVGFFDCGLAVMTIAGGQLGDEDSHNEEAHGSFNIGSMGDGELLVGTGPAGSSRTRRWLKLWPRTRRACSPLPRPPRSRRQGSSQMPVGEARTEWDENGRRYSGNGAADEGYLISVAPELCHRYLASICSPQYLTMAKLRLRWGPPMPDVRLFPSGPYGPAEGREVIRSHLPLTVDEEGGGARYTAQVSALDVRRTRPAHQSSLRSSAKDFTSSRVPLRIGSDLGGQPFWCRAAGRASPRRRPAPPLPRMPRPPSQLWVYVRQR